MRNTEWDLDNAIQRVSRAVGSLRMAQATVHRINSGEWERDADGYSCDEQVMAEVAGLLSLAEDNAKAASEMMERIKEDQ